MGYLEPGQEPKYFQANIPGSVAPEERGEMREYLWSKLGLIFIPKESHQTLAEMEPEEYAQWRSIRNISAGKQFSEWLSQK